MAQIPPGRAATYGDIASIARVLTGRGGPRSVGALMSASGGELPWWRVVNARGQVPARLRESGLVLLRREHCPLTHDGDRVDLRLARWIPE